MSIAIIPSESPPANDTTSPQQRGPYARYADVFSRIFSETGSIEIALEVYETFRAREQLHRPKRIDLPHRIVEISASLFGVPPKRVFEVTRRRDVVSARWIASWLLQRRRWSEQRIGDFFNIDHSTVHNGLRRVAANQELLLAAHNAELTLHLDLTEANELADIVVAQSAQNSGR